MRDAVKEIGGAVDRIDDPARLGRIAGEKKPQSGLAFLSSSTSACSARLSAIETKSAGPLRLTCSCSTSPKSRRMRGAALRAARCMTVMRPEWDTIDFSPLPAGRGWGWVA
jgi:hypothetical protein